MLIIHILFLEILKCVNRLLLIIKIFKSSELSCILSPLSYNESIILNTQN